MNTKSFILLCVALFGLFAPSFQQEQDPEKFLDHIHSEAKSVVMGAGVDGITIENTPGGIENLSIEFTELSPRDSNEWTFEVITEDGEVYNFVDDNGHLDVHGPNGLNVDVSHSYAEYAGIDDGDAADDFGEWVVEYTGIFYEAAGREQLD